MSASSIRLLKFPFIPVPFPIPATTRTGRTEAMLKNSIEEVSGESEVLVR